MRITPKKFKAEIPHMQHDAYDADAYFFWERGKEASILSYFQQELRKMEAYAILEEIKNFELQTIVADINPRTDIKDIVKTVRQHFKTHGALSVLASTIDDSAIKEFHKDITPVKLLESKIFHLALEIKLNFRLAQKDPDRFFQKTNAASNLLLKSISLSDFLKTDSQTAREVSDEYVMQKNIFRNGKLDKQKFTLGWEYTTDFVDKKISFFEEEVKKNTDLCDKYFANSVTATKITRNENTKKLFEKIDKDFESYNELKKLKSAIIQFREHGSEFSTSELRLNDEMLNDFVNKYKAEILADVKSYREQLSLKRGVKKPKITDVAPPEIFLPVIPIVEMVNKIAEHFSKHEFPLIKIYDSGQKSVASLSRKITQDMYEGKALNIADGIRNTISYDNEAGFEVFSKALSKYLDSKGIIYTYDEEVVGSGYHSRKFMIPITLNKVIEMPNSAGHVKINSTRIAEVKVTRGIDLSLKKETDFLYQIFRQVCPENDKGKRNLLQIEINPEYSLTKIANNRDTAKQVFEELYSGIYARPKLRTNIEELNCEQHFNFPLQNTSSTIDSVLRTQDTFIEFTYKIRNAEKLLNNQNLNSAPIETKKAYYECAQKCYKKEGKAGSETHPNNFFNEKSLLELKEAFNQDKQERKLTASR